MKKQVYAGIDLHSNNLVVAIVDKQGHRIGHQKLSCELCEVIAYLKGLKMKVIEVAVESTFNWYWLVDGLADAGYEVKLAHPAGMNQYEGLKHANDKTDAYFIAELMRLGILECGYIYERESRGVRDLLRRRQMLVNKRTSLILVLKNQYARNTGKTLRLSELKGRTPAEVGELFENRYDILAGEITKTEIEHLSAAITRIEAVCWKQARCLPGYRSLNTLSGIGPVLSGTILLETGDIDRFASPECFASYCRTVAAKKFSNGKKKGENNAKNGNKYLAWAFIEAANFARRYDENARRWFDRKAARTSKVIATKALACKICKASWHLMKHGGSYDPARLFGRA